MRFYCDCCDTTTEICLKNTCIQKCGNVKLVKKDNDKQDLYIRCSGCDTWYYLLSVPIEKFKIPVSN